MTAILKTPGRLGLALASALASALALIAFAPAFGFDLNESIRIGAGETSGGESTVNGGIEVGRDAVVDGALETVNGGIRVDANARTGRIETVNGGIRLGAGVTAAAVSSVNGAIEAGDDVTVDGEVSVVNGRIELGRGTRVARDVSNVNGEIEVAGGDIGGSLSTVNGDVRLAGDTVLRGDLVVEKPNDGFWDRNGREKPRIVIGPGVRVLGNVELEREVDLYISESAQVGGVTGAMSMDDAVRFSGDRP